MTYPNLVTSEFKALSAKLGRDPLQVQGPGGNTSIKNLEVMYIKASGTELADAEDKDIFVAVDRYAATMEAKELAGDGSCQAAVLDKTHGLRPSIETTFHAALNHAVVAHTHSVATIAHAISPEGRLAAIKKLEGLPFAIVPYAKPGLPLTREILLRVTPETKVIILQNHGLICAGDTVAEVEALLEDVEKRLELKESLPQTVVPNAPAPDGFGWSEFSWIAKDDTISGRVRNGTYYPDHVVFLGPALPTEDHAGKPPAILVEGEGICIRDGATPSQKAMLRCISDVFSRLPDAWSVEAIGKDAELELLDWDAEKYRQALAARA